MCLFQFWLLQGLCLRGGLLVQMVILFHRSWHCSANFISAEVNRSSFLLLTIEVTHWLMQICGTYPCLSLIGKGTGVNMNTPTFIFFNFFFFTAFHYSLYCIVMCKTLFLWVLRLLARLLPITSNDPNQFFGKNYANIVDFIVFRLYLNQIVNIFWKI